MIHMNEPLSPKSDIEQIETGMFMTDDDRDI